MHESPLSALSNSKVRDFQHNRAVVYLPVAASPVMFHSSHITQPYPGKNFYLDNIVNVYLAILVFIQRVGDAEQLVLWNALDLPHDTNELTDAYQVLPTGKEHAVYRKQSCITTKWCGIWWRRTRLGNKSVSCNYRRRASQTTFHNVYVMSPCKWPIILVHFTKIW